MAIKLEAAMPGSRRAEIHKQTRLFDDFFKIDEVMVSHERQDGTMSPDERRLIFERGDSVAVLLYNPETNAVVMVNQFKVPTLIARRRDNPATEDGWITEATAGMIDEKETPEQAVIRETMEETGYKIGNPLLISRFFSSPGGTSERIFLYFAEVRETDRIGKGGGLDGEDVGVVHKSASDLFGMLERKQIEDPKLAIAAYWLKDHLGRTAVCKQTAVISPIAAAAAAPASPSRPASGPLTSSTVRYKINGKSGLIVGYKTGLIDDVKGVDIWVNSENTDMMMDRFIGKTISARIRFLGANKEDDTVIEDTIQESLRGVIGERAHVKIGTVLVTESGMLAGTHGVQRVFHVATVEGAAGEGVKANPAKIKQCVVNILRRVDHENRKLWRIIRNKNLNSILLPMLGTGDGGLSLDAVAADLIPVAINYFVGSPNPTLKEIYFLAYGAPHKAALDKMLGEQCAAGALAP